MKKLIYSLVGLALCGLQGCVDLDMAPYNQIASGNMWTNSSLTNQGVAGVYNALRGWGVYSSSYDMTTSAFEAMGMTTDAYRTISYTKGTAGSGDSFWGVFLSRIYLGGATSKEKLAALDNATLAEYCRFANASGSSCASRPGGIPALPTEDQVKEVMDNYPLLERGFTLN